MFFNRKTCSQEKKTVHPVKMGASSTRIWEPSCDVQNTNGAGRGVGANMKNGSVSDRWVRVRDGVRLWRLRKWSIRGGRVDVAPLVVGVPACGLR